MPRRRNYGSGVCNGRISRTSKLRQRGVRAGAYRVSGAPFPYAAYIQGRVGVVDALCGVYTNPESLAHGGDGLPRQPLYRIRLRQTDLWPEYGGIRPTLC